MTINYLDSKRIQGLSTDIVETPTFSDDYTTNSGWTQTGSTITVNTGSTRIDYDGQINGVNGSRLYHDMGIGVISNTKWVLRFPWNVTTATTNSGLNQPYGFFGISDEITTGVTEPNDCIGIRWSSEPLIYQINSRNNGSATNTSFSRAPQVEQIYIEIIRTSTTNVTINFYSDSGYSTLLETKSQTISSSIVNLRYIVFWEYDASGYVSGGGRLISTIDDLKFYNGTTTSKPTIAIPLTGCKAYYNFEQTSGNLINQATTANGFTDGLGSSADGTNNGATQTATGKIGNAWDFDGSNDFVQLSNYFNFLHNPSTSGTISAWIKHDVNSGGQFIISTFGNANDVNGIWTGSLGGMVFGLRPDGNPYYATVADNPSAWVVAENDSNNLATGVWYNIVFTKENNTFKVYVNGVLDASITASSTLRSGNSYATPTIGKHSDGSGYVFLNGGIDDLSIWSRALTSNEITNLYNSGSGKLLDTQTNVQTNSIFEQTNTGVRYWYNGTVWKPEYYFAIIASHFYVTTNTEKLDYNTTTTSNSTSLSTAKSGTCAFGTEHIGYFAGGAVTGGYSTSSERFAYSDSVVSSSATLSVYHGWGGAWSRPTIGYVVKGNSGGAYGTTVEKFSHSTNTYSTGTSMTQSSSNGTHQSITIGYSTGRWANGSFGDTQKYTFSSDGVTSGTSLLTTTSAHCASSTQADGIIMGGQTGNSIGFQTRIEKYNHSTDAITLHGSSLTTSGNLNQGYGNTKNAYAIQISQDNNVTISNKLNHPTGTITSFNVLLSGNSGSSTTTENEVII